MEINKNTWFFDLLWLGIFIAIFFGFMLGCRALSVPDEARYTEIPREMLLFHDFITPHLDGVKYFEKPPLLYWIQAGIIYLFGLNEFFLRIPSAFFGLLGCLASYILGRFCFNRSTGIFAALILATSPLYFAMAHSITLDMTVSLWISMTLCSFLIAVDLPKTSKARRYVSWLIFIFAALAVMTKGLIGILLPGTVIFSWLLIFNRWNEVLKLYLPSGIIIFLLIVLPWHILVQTKNPEFFHFYFVQQQFTRYLTKASGRYQPLWWFIPILIGGFFPWIVFLPQAFMNALRTTWVNRFEKQKEIFLACWAIEIFIFFSLSHSKLIPYILPVFFPLAVLVGRRCSVIMETRNFGGSFTWTGISASIFAILLAVTLFSVQYWHHNFSLEVLFYLRWIAILLLLMALGIYLIKHVGIKLLWIFLMQIALLWSIVVAMPYFDLRPVKSLAVQLKTLAKPTDIVASYGLYYQDLPVYAERLVLIVDWQNELAFGYHHQDSAKKWMIGSDEFWKMWQQPKRVFALMDEDDYQRNQKSYKIYICAKHGGDLLVSNQP